LAFFYLVDLVHLFFDKCKNLLTKDFQDIENLVIILFLFENKLWANVVIQKTEQKLHIYAQSTQRNCSDATVQFGVQSYVFVIVSLICQKLGSHLNELWQRPKRNFLVYLLIHIVFFHTSQFLFLSFNRHFIIKDVNRLRQNFMKQTKKTTILIGYTHLFQYFRIFKKHELKTVNHQSFLLQRN
jgi:hypothetical protein